VTISLVREDARVRQALEVLAQVADPEVPAVSVCDLGIVRDVLIEQGTLRVVLTPTYSGCPATEVIERNVVGALEAAGLGPIRASMRRAPAWTTDWISEQGRAKLRAYGIAPPCTEAGTQEQPIRLLSRKARGVPACPRCGSADTELVSQFGSTACKALHRCASCREPFEYFKPI
jgi:ring-1,2-phenylacetyl-CoA epoxidase subunit PaaD